VEKRFKHQAKRPFMQAVILAGGVGSRLRPWTASVPKPLLPMLDLTLLEQVLWGLPEGTVDEVVVAGGYRVEQIQAYFANTDLNVRIVPEREPLGTGGALGNCRDVVSGRFACFNGDVISSLNMQDLSTLHSNNGGIGTLALWEVEDPTRFGIVGLDEEQRITRFKEKPAPEEVFSHLINAGSYLLEDDIFDVMPEGRHSLERDVFPALAERGELNGLPFEGYFIDAGTPTSWSSGVEACIEHRRYRTGGLVGTSWFADPSMNLEAEHAWSMVAGGVVASGTTLRRSTLLEGATVGRGSVLDACLIGPGAVVGSGCVLNDVVLGPGATVADGEHLTGERRAAEDERSA
jgi:mannose-1-phosphate guanylyltransferase